MLRIAGISGVRKSGIGLVLALVAAGLVVGAWAWRRAPAGHHRGDAGTPMVQMPTQRKAAVERVAAHLKQADERSLKGIEEALALLDAWFKEAKKGTTGFAEDALAWGSKWRIVADRVPYARGDRHAAYLRERFAVRIFTGAALQHEIEAAVRSHAMAMRAAEGEMLVGLKMDLADMGSGTQVSMTRGDAKAWESTFAGGFQDAAERSHADLRGEVVRQLSSTIAGEVMTMAAVRLGVSEGLLAAGAGSSWATFGVGLVVGILADWIVERIWERWADPVGELARAMDAKLDDFHRILVDGDGVKPGLRGRLQAMNDEQAMARRRIVEELIEGRAP